MPLLALLGAAPAIGAMQDTDKKPTAAAEVRPDFSHVTSLSAAKKLADAGKLTKVLLFPAELGGPDVVENVAYVTPEAAAELASNTEKLSVQVEKGLIDTMNVATDYKGRSVVPSRIVMTAKHGKRRKEYSYIIEIW